MRTLLFTEMPKLFSKNTTKLGLLLQTGSQYCIIFCDKIGHYGDIWHCFCFRIPGLNDDVIHMYPSTCSSVRCVLVLDMTFFIIVNSYSQLQLLLNSDLSSKVTQYYEKCTRAAPNTSVGLIFYEFGSARTFTVCAVSLKQIVTNWKFWTLNLVLLWPVLH
jgi:hypothetical protein